MTRSLSHTNLWLPRLVASGFLIGQVTLLTSLLQVASAESAIAQTASKNPSITQFIPNLKQCQWTIAKRSVQQPARERLTSQTLLRETEDLLAIVQEPIQLALQSKPLLTEADVSIGGDAAIADKCWRNF